MTSTTNENLSPQERIINYIRTALQTGELKPNMKLPAERKLAEQFNIGRAYVREALLKLETYGIIKTMPQSGRIIVGLDSIALDGLITDVMKLNSFDFESLAEMRVILEVNAAKLCAEKCTEADLKLIKVELDNYIDACTRGAEDIETYDFSFHRAIATASKNTVLKSMLMLITPNLMAIYKSKKVCAAEDTKSSSFHEHLEIYYSIENHNAKKAGAVMRQHLSNVLEFAREMSVQEQVLNA